MRKIENTNIDNIEDHIDRVVQKIQKSILITFFSRFINYVKSINFRHKSKQS